MPTCALPGIHFLELVDPPPIVQLLDLDMVAADAPQRAALNEIVGFACA